MYFFLLFLFSSISTNSLVIPAQQFNAKNLKSGTTFYSKDTTRNLFGNSETKTNNLKNKSKTHKGEKSANRRAIWGFIFGCASIVLFPLFCIPGLILSNDAIWEERAHPGILTRRNKTFAYLGKIFSYVGLAIIVIAILYLAFIIAFLSALG